MQIAARTAVYGPAGDLIGRIVFLAEADKDSPSALIIEARVIEAAIPEFPDLQGAVIDLEGRDGDMPEVTKGKIVVYLNGEAAHYHENDAAKHYIELCQAAKTTPPEP